MRRMYTKRHLPWGHVILLQKRFRLRAVFGGTPRGRRKGLGVGGVDGHGTGHGGLQGRQAVGRAHVAHAAFAHQVLIINAIPGGKAS